MPRITSTNCITGAGLKKCMPITCAGLAVALATSVMDRDEVLEARIVDGLQRLSSSAKIFFLMALVSL